MTRDEAVKALVDRLTGHGTIEFLRVARFCSFPESAFAREADALEALVREVQKEDQPKSPITAEQVKTRAAADGVSLTRAKALLVAERKMQKSYED